MRLTKKRGTGTVMGVIVVLALVSLTTFAGTAHAATITVTTTVPGVNDDAQCSLQESIYAANLDAAKAPDPAHLADPDAFIATGCAAGSGPDVIVLPANATFTMSGPTDDVANYTGPTATPIVWSVITIEGAGSRIQHGGGTRAYRAFAVGWGGSLTLHEIHVKGFEVQGGDGRTGGAGGLGAGGAVYVNNGHLGVGWSTFEQNGAIGGDGSTGSIKVGGGGGGLGGNGGRGFPGSAFPGGGGGGGARGTGGDGDSDNFSGGSGGGGGGTVRDGESGDDDPETGTGELAGGLACGAAGGHTDIGFGNDDGDSATFCPGGGGGGGESFRPGLPGAGNGDGGSGGYGGGGGGGGDSDGDGGDGGFGAGGGGGTTGGSKLNGLGPDGGDGGFGAGGGSGAGGFIAGGPGAGGTFGGDGDKEHGGGGGGLGGAIFGHDASITIINSTFVNNYTQRGHFGGGDSHDGRATGGAIFLVQGSLSVNNATFRNNLTDGVGDLGGGGIAVYKPTGAATSLTLRNSILAGNGPHECYLRNGASYSGTHNLIVDSTENGHGDIPCSGVTQSDDPQLGALAMNFPGRTPTMAIPVTSPAVDGADPATSEPDDQRGVLRPGGAEDIGAFEADDSPPVTTIALSPAAPNGSNGWYTTAVGVSVTAQDNDVEQTRCGLNLSNSPTSFDDLPDVGCTPFNVVVDSPLHTIYAASRDASGNTESPLVTRTFKIDRNAPTLSPALSASPIVGQLGVTASPNASDWPSGVASSSCGSVDTSTPGVKTVTCTATDNAGNTNSVDFAYVVEYRILGFFDPVPGSKWKVLSTVPVKIALGNAGGVRVSDAVGQSLAANCRVRFSATGAQTKSAECMKYDAEKNQFVYGWRLGRSGTGPATILVTVGYPGTTLTTQKTLPITITK